ncbi:hypothetical protein MITSMUL_05143 [Mitsuokella multacida DSM 20544]|uniref:Uncharacterized protein n=1 Tax=Mitsuokella multacida DSM 20544 TaxID=500635 RepID=C9KPI6_9FIRM|nr:hypothetical protein MITSMUL_05143 [Mitsuokella multacida DSM 20544]
MYYMHEELDYITSNQIRFELVKTNQYALIIAQTARFSNKKGGNQRFSQVEQLPSYIACA